MRGENFAVCFCTVLSRHGRQTDFYHNQKKLCGFRRPTIHTIPLSTKVIKCRLYGFFSCLRKRSNWAKESNVSQSSPCRKHRNSRPIKRSVDQHVRGLEDWWRTRTRFCHLNFGPKMFWLDRGILIRIKQKSMWTDVYSYCCF